LSFPLGLISDVPIVFTSMMLSLQVWRYVV
jgi:hypothetical protein